jgi:hypothetical protein
MTRARKSRPQLFVSLGVFMLLGGFGLMLSAALGGRLGSAEAFSLPLGFTAAAVGGMLLTRTPLAVFFLFLFALAGLILALRETGLQHPAPYLFAALLALCLPLAKRAKA